LVPGITSTPKASKPQELRGALSAGSRLRSYEILSVLGQGAFGITYRARDTTLNREVAVKEFLPTSLALREGDVAVMPRSTELRGEFLWGRDRFLEEARTLAKLEDAPAVIRVLDFLEENGTAYMVMALAQGETLGQRIKRSGRLPPHDIELILYPLLDGLEQVHEMGFLHRDIKPDNIVRDESGVPTLIDFGAARAAMADRSTAMTAVFTPGYAAIEQFTSSKQGPWTDIYGLSATLYHAVTGAAPPSAIDRLLEDTYRPLATMASIGLSPSLAAGIDAGLAVRAVDRPQSIAAWRSSLALAAAQSADSTVIGPKPRPAAILPPPSASAWRPRRIGFVAAAAFGLVTLSAGGYFLLTPKPAPSVPALHDMTVEPAEKQSVAEEVQNKATADAAARQAQRQADDERAARQAEEEARRRADAETRRLADEALARAQADRQLAAQEAARKAEAEAKQQADAQAAAVADRKSAEAAETALRFGLSDRQRIQVALTSLGFDTHGYDGVLGPRSREMIGAWQNAHSQPPTGFLSESQYQLLLGAAAPAIARYDNEQKKQADEKKKAEEETTLRASQPAISASPSQAGSMAAGASPKTGAFDGTYSGRISYRSGSQPISIRMVNGVGTGTWMVRRCNARTDFTIRVYPDGNAILDVHGYNTQCERVVVSHAAHINNNQVRFTWNTPEGQQDVALSRAN
jgi:serine/threonine protein kinase/peptidoglycan hydrolase-like protein with peptidoglycan-binding domain